MGSSDTDVTPSANNVGSDVIISAACKSCGGDVTPLAAFSDSVGADVTPTPTCKDSCGAEFASPVVWLCSDGADITLSLTICKGSSEAVITLSLSCCKDSTENISLITVHCGLCES